MALFWSVLSAFNLILVVVLIAMVQMARLRIVNLQHVDIEPPRRWPSVSVVVAARNEQRSIEPALRSLLELDYEPMEILVIDDRSEDETPHIVERLRAQHDCLKVVRIDHLPDGWLGKNHALCRGAEQATGDYLLFTDADVVMRPETLRRSIAYAEQHAIDHLCLAPQADVPTLLLKAFVLFFTNMFLLYTRAWKVSDPNSTAFVGIGAFNLVRRHVYIAAGTHKVIAMRPDDDVKLGKIIKQHGFRQQLLDGAGIIRVPWYHSLSELIHGMEKNAFSGVEYSVLMVLGITFVLLAFDIWPMIGLCVLHGLPQILYGLVVACLFGSVWVSARQVRVTSWVVLFWPAAVLLLIYIQWRAMLLTYWQGGIRWRGTLYPLDQLRQNRV